MRVFKTILAKGSFILIGLSAGQNACAGPVPAIVSVATPSGERVRFALPERMCAYPDAVRNNLANVLADGQPKVVLLGAGGNCESMTRYAHGVPVIISPTNELSMLADQTNPQTRLTPLAYERWCFEKYPANGAQIGQEGIRRNLRKIDKDIVIGQESSLGLLASTREAVYGGVTQALAIGQRRYLQVQVIACFAPKNVPVLWTFAAATAPNASHDQIAQAISSLLAQAKVKVHVTMSLNQ